MDKFMCQSGKVFGCTFQSIDYGELSKNSGEENFVDKIMWD